MPIQVHPLDPVNPSLAAGPAHRPGDACKLCGGLLSAVPSPVAAAIVFTVTAARWVVVTVVPAACRSVGNVARRIRAR
jgi:hypothetical protein